MELQHRMRIDHIFEEFISKDSDENKHIIPKNFQCLKKMMSVFEERCGGKMDEYDL